MPASDILIDVESSEIVLLSDEAEDELLLEELLSGGPTARNPGDRRPSSPPLEPAERSQIDALWKLLEAEPDRRDVFEQLERRYAAKRCSEDLVELYLFRVEHVSDAAARSGILVKTARLLEEELRDVEQAFDAALLAWSLNHDDDDVFELLTRLAKRTKRWSEVLQTADTALAEAADKDTRVTLWLQCAQWHTDLNKPDQALHYYEQVRALHPHSADLLWSMVVLLETQGRLGEAARLCHQVGELVDVSEEPAFAAEAFKKLGQLCNRLGNRDEAAKYYEHALRIVPEDLSATHSLDELTADSPENVRLLKLLERRLREARAPDAVRTAKLELARAYEQRSADVEKAQKLYNELRHADAHDLEALRGLSRVLRRRSQWARLADVLQAQLELEPSNVETHQQLARVWQEHLPRPAKAAECLESLLKLDPTQYEALHDLASLYRRLRQWDLLAFTLERCVAHTADRAEQVRIHEELGQLYVSELSASTRAINSYRQLVAIDSQHTAALRALVKLYDEREDSEASLDVLEQLVTAVEDRGEQVDILFRMGELHRDTRHDNEAALELFEMALEINPKHVEAIGAARQIYGQHAQWERVAALLKREAKHHARSSVSAELYVQLGKLYDNTLGEHGRAIQAFEWASDRDPNNEAAASWLVADYMRSDRFEEAFPILKRMVWRSSKRSADVQHGLAFMLGRCAAKMGRHTEAIRAYQRAYELNPEHLKTGKALASAYYNNKNWKEAFRSYQRLIQGFERHELGEEEAEHIFYRLGVCKNELNDPRGASRMFQMALDEAPHHRPSLEALLKLYERYRQPEQVINCKWKLVELTPSATERVQLIDEIAELWKNDAENIAPAIDAWCEALHLEPTNVRVLTKLLDAYQQTRQWDHAIAVINRLEELEPRAKAKAKCSYTAGVILRDELRNLDASLAKFDEALDHDVEHLKAFEAINKLLTARKNWRGLERAYRKMIHRLINRSGEDDKSSVNDDLQHQLFYSLGLIYRDRLRDYEAAADTFKTAAALKPDKKQQRILAELYTMLPGRTGEAIASHHALIEEQPCRVASHQALYRLYLNQGAYDRAWCFANTLCFLQKADAEQQRFFHDYRRQGPIRPTTSMTRAAWFGELAHPNQDRYVTKIMELMAPAALAVKAASDRALQLDRLRPTDPSQSKATLAQTFAFAAQVLNTPTVPRLFVQPHSLGGLAHIPGSNPPAVFCGGTLLTGYTPRELMFVLGRFLTYYETGHFVRTLFASHSELRLLFLSSLRMSGMGRHAEPGVDSWSKKLAPHLNGAQRAAMREVAVRFARSGGSTDIKKWMQGVELTAIRAGYLLCDDLAVACRMTQTLPPDGSIDVPPKQKLEEIVRFAASEPYFRLRERLGLTITGT